MNSIKLRIVEYSSIFEKNKNSAKNLMENGNPINSKQPHSINVVNVGSEYNRPEIERDDLDENRL